MTSLRTSRPLACAAFGALLLAAPLARAQANASLPAPASAAPASIASVPHPFAYGILVGTNAGGAGQTELRYAEDDARRMAQVLEELGRYGTTDMRVLVRPDGAAVLGAVEQVAAKLRAHRVKGEQAVLVFYYSGHAKANAFSLGSEELPIATLREKLRQLPSTLTLVVLDACQSGQFARTKGTEPAADFSFNSVSRLTTKGIAVMASSSAQELSQESDELHSSYFTHHLIVGLRGAADGDGDGRVSLDEAYRYAYRRTLVSTSQTKVGGQHVTLETDLAGHGDVPVTYPSDARLHLVLPASLDARVLVHHRTSGSVVAEVQKAPGAAVRLAFAAGSYEALVRQTSPTRVLKCAVNLERTIELDLGGCQSVALSSVAKGGSGGGGDDWRGGDSGMAVEADRVETPHGQAPTPAPTTPPWQVEAAFGPLWRGEDPFTRRLNEFGYKQTGIFKGTSLRFHAGASKGITPHLSIGGYVHKLEGDDYERRVSNSSDSFGWSAYGASAFARASMVPLGAMRPGAAFLELYAQGAAGVSLGFTSLTTGSPKLTRSKETSETFWGYVVGGHVGAAIGTRSPVILFLQGGYEYAPTIANLLGDVRDSGGPSVQLGMRVRFR